MIAEAPALPLALIPYPYNNLFGGPYNNLFGGPYNSRGRGAQLYIVGLNLYGLFRENSREIIVGAPSAIIVGGRGYGLWLIQ